VLRLQLFKPKKSLTIELTKSEATSPRLPVAIFDGADPLSELSRLVDHHTRRGELGRADEASRKLLALAQGQDLSVSVPALPTNFKVHRPTRKERAICIAGALITSMILIATSHRSIATSLYNSFMESGMASAAIAALRLECAIESLYGRPLNLTLDRLADALICDGRMTEAAAITQRVVDSEKTVGQDWAYDLNGFIKLQAEDYRGAEQAFREGMARNIYRPRDGLAYLLSCYVAEGKMTEASAIVSVLGLITPDTLPAPPASIAEALGDYAGATGNLADQRMWYAYCQRANHRKFKLQHYQYVRVAKKIASSLRILGYNQNADAWDKEAAEIYKRYGLQNTELVFSAPLNF
jgi:hypothetical protein